MLTATIALVVVIAVQDGDTITVERAGEPIIIRLAEIDAPELKQPHGAASRQALIAICLDKPAEFTAQKRDRYGRTVARVSCAGTDTSREQVRAGMAWVFDRYVTDRSLYDVQTEAQDKRRGLWADDRPTPPWLWRRK